MKLFTLKGKNGQKIESIWTDSLANALADFSTSHQGVFYVNGKKVTL